MPFDVPLLPTIIQRAVSDLAGTASDALRRSDAQVLARLHGGGMHLAYGYQQWISKQIFSDTCDEEMLLRLAKLRLPGGRKPAVASTGKVTLTGRALSPVDVGTQMQTTDYLAYVTTAAITLDATGVGTANVAAQVAGRTSDLDAGTPLTLIAPVPGVSDSVVVAVGGISGGSDQESIDELRKRVNASFQRIPMGGDSDDYEAWALEVPGVTRAWPVRRYMGPGTVGLFFVRDDDVSPIPDAGEVATVQTYVDGKRPLGAELYVRAPVPHLINPVLHISPDTPAIRLAVTSALNDLVVSEGAPGGTIFLSHINEAISGAIGEDDHVLTTPTANVVVAVNELAMLGVIAWT